MYNTTYAPSAVYVVSSKGGIHPSIPHSQPTVILNTASSEEAATYCTLHHGVPIKQMDDASTTSYYIIRVLYISRFRKGRSKIVLASDAGANALKPVSHFTTFHFFLLLPRGTRIQRQNRTIVRVPGFRTIVSCTAVFVVVFSFYQFDLLVLCTSYVTLVPIHE